MGISWNKIIFRIPISVFKFPFHFWNRLRENGKLENKGFQSLISGIVPILQKWIIENILILIEKAIFCYTENIYFTDKIITYYKIGFYCSYKQ